MACLRALCSAKITSLLVPECDEALETLARTVEVSLVLRHRRQKIADELAHHGVNQPCHGSEPYLGIPCY